MHENEWRGTSVWMSQNYYASIDLVFYIPWSTRVMTYTIEATSPRYCATPARLSLFQLWHIYSGSDLV